VSTTPAADFCRTVRVNLSTLRHASVTCSRSPAISSTAFDTRPPDLPPASWMDTDCAIRCSLVRRRRPQIRFWYIGPYLCSTLPSDPASRRRPCASLPFTSTSSGRDSHPLAVEHARLMTKRATRSFESPSSRFVSVTTSPNNEVLLEGNLSLDLNQSW
jgi:hypothetical protein